MICYPTDWIQRVSFKRHGSLGWQGLIALGEGIKPLLPIESHFQGHPELVTISVAGCNERQVRLTMELLRSELSW